jgi:hypothetical protein
MSLWTRIKQALGLSYTPKSYLAKQYKASVVQRYIDAGLNFGDAVSYIYMGECDGFDKLLSIWEESEREYAALGYRTIPIDAFVQAGGWGKALEEIGTLREPSEEAVLHAAYYRENYLGKVPGNGIVQKTWETGQSQRSFYRLPTTAHLVANSNANSEEEAI